MKRLAAALAITAVFYALPAAAQFERPFDVAQVWQRQEGGDHVFTFNVRNLQSDSLRLAGRIVIINVYDTSPPVILPVEGITVAPGSEAALSGRWSEAPLAGRARVILVLSDGNRTFVEAYDFWLAPASYAVIAAAGAAGIVVLIALALLIMKLAKAVKRRLPANMTAHMVEEGDTVVTLSNIFGVSWQEIVKANRLKPPYALKTGARLLIPKRPLPTPPVENRG